MFKSLWQWYCGSASIRKKLVISYFVLVTIPILTLGFYSFSISRRNLMEQTEATMRNNVVQMTEELNATLKRENDNIKYLSYNSKFRQTLKNSGGNLAEIAGVLNEVVEPIFWYFITSDSNLKGIEIYSPYVAYEVGSFLKPAESCLEKSWYQYHLKGFNTLWTWEEGELFATRTLMDAPTSSENIGVLKMNVYPGAVFVPVAKTDFLDNGILILDSSGQVIYEKESHDNALDAKIKKRFEGKALPDAGAVDQKYGSVRRETDSGDKYLLVQSRVPESGWMICYYVNQLSVTSRLYGMIRSTLLVVGICIAVIVFMISILSRVLSRRILELKENAEKVAEGNFDLDIDTGYRDEIGTVARSLQMMNDRLKEMIAKVYQAELEKKVMELKALQAMINPHFLYNCLSSIKWKAIRSGNDEISELTGVLAKFYRTSLNGGKQITTVENELENIKAYIALQQMVRSSPFDVDYDLDELAFACQMPNFLLQPLVENAIEHGISCHEDDSITGYLRIELEAADSFLIFRIINNGPQMETERLEHILNTPGKGYGIFNIQERIRIYYGKECGVRANLTKEGYTCFQIMIKNKLDEMADLPIA